MKPTDKLTLHTNSLINACNSLNNKAIKSLQDQVRQDVLDVLTIIEEQEELIETLINESDEGVDNV
jgi:hypothetical protein